jgi:hypothetical protein
MSVVRDVTVLLAVVVSLLGLSTFWLNQVNKFVPEPYLVISPFYVITYVSALC